MPSKKLLRIESLNSWKEIALYLDRGVRTVQRWERELELPVHRVGRGPRSRVHAFASELRAWLLRLGQIATDHTVQHSSSKRIPHADGTLAASRILVNRSSALVKQIVQSMWIQQQRAQELMVAIEVVRRHIRSPRSAKKESRLDGHLAQSRETGRAARLDRAQDPDVETGTVRPNGRKLPSSAQWRPN